MTGLIYLLGPSSGSCLESLPEKGKEEVGRPQGVVAVVIGEDRPGRGSGGGVGRSGWIQEVFRRVGPGLSQELG